MPAENCDASADDIVLSGLSGRLPESDTIEEFAKNLFDGVDLITADDRRWTPGLYGLPERNGKLKNIKHFDATCFGVSPKLANFMDPQLRMLLELTHEAIVDAGFNPNELRGSHTGVYVGISSSDTTDIWSYDEDKIHGYELSGCARNMFSNRLSYDFHFKGPSYTIDTACSSSTHAFAQATADIRAGKCDAAIVAGANICLLPATSLFLHRFGLLSPVGRSAAFDADGQGYVRSEAVVAMLLQRRRDCRRLYCTVRGARTNSDGYKTKGITYPSGAAQLELAQKTFEEARLRPQDVAYVEAHGTGTKVGDPEEVNAIADLFCVGRATPLLIGSIKSNMGHSEAAAGLCSIAKVVLAMECGVIPGNLHYRTPNPEIPALIDGRIKVVDQNTPWQGGLVAVNSFGFGGANAHVILESQGGERPPPVSYSVPRLVLASGRTEAAAVRLLKLASDNPRDAELHALLDAVHEQAILQHTHRGFLILDHERDVPLVLEVIEMEMPEMRPIWFVFSGMGSQSSGVARDLMQLPVFAASIERSTAALRPLGLDLSHLLTEASEADFNSVINSMVSIVAVQVALIDTLRKVGIHPDGIVGHSIGEIGCAYADEGLTAEQAVLCAYWRARSIADAALPPGAMAAVGLPWAEAARRCPPYVFPACHNWTDSVTVSGPPESVKQLVAKLKSEGVFTRHVKSSGIAFHSKYVAAAAPQLRSKLLDIIPSPLPRSPRWHSTSLRPDQQDSEWGKLCSAEYHVNNMLSPVRFADALCAIPERAIVVEVAPHALLHALLRRARPAAAHVPLVRREQPGPPAPLVRREQPGPLAQLLRALGRLFAAGALPRVAALYPSVRWPVSRGTPPLASAIEWDHSIECTVPDYKSTKRTGDTIFEFDLSTPEQMYLAGHNIDGCVFFPAAGYLMLVWSALAKRNNLNIDEAAILLEDIHFRRLTILSREAPLHFLVTLFTGSGSFEICEGGTIVVTGRAHLVSEPAAERLSITSSAVDDPVEDIPLLDADDIYKELRLRGYNYLGSFRGIVQSDAYCTQGSLTWNKNWVTFIDTMLQFDMIAQNTRELKLPSRILSVIIDPAMHSATAMASSDHISVHRYSNLSVIMAGGVQLRDVKYFLRPCRSKVSTPPKLEKFVFTPIDTRLTELTSLSKRDGLTAALQLMLENSSSVRFRVAEVALGRFASELLLPLVLPILDAEPQVCVDATLAAGANAANYTATMVPLGVKMSNKEFLDGVDSQCQLVLGANILTRQDNSVLCAIAAMLNAQGHILLEEPSHVLDKPGVAALLEGACLVAEARLRATSCEYVLLRRATTLPGTRIVLEVRDDDFSWVEALRDAMKRAESEELRVYVWSRDIGSGVLGLGTCLRLEPGGDKLRVYYLPDAVDIFDPAAPTYRAQVKLDLAFNVLRSGVWGTFSHLLLDDLTNLQVQVEHAYVDVLTRGDLSSLRWIESDLQYAADAPQNVYTALCHVYYAPLNFRDIMVASGKLPPDSLPSNLTNQECMLGLEFSGRSSSGNRVMGIVPAKGLATSVVADKDFLWDVPSAWSLEEAATVPVAYATAYYALVVRGRMQRGDSVLVHAGAGGVGQAAVCVALHAGCTVFTTVGTPEKRAFLRERYPALPDSHIGNSRDCSFEQLVLERTHGRGVDLVLNSLAGKRLEASLRCLAEGGRFLEIGKIDLSANSPLGMAVLLKNTTVHGIILDALLCASQDHHDKKMLARCVSEGIASGAIRPLPATVYTDCQLEKAFRYMAAGKHIGKVVVRVRAEESSAPAPVPRRMPARPRALLHPARSYVLVGGLGGFGLELCDWLVKQGARTLLLNSRSGMRTGYQAWRIRRWREKGVQVGVSTSDATTLAGARALLNEAARAAPVGGIFNLAAVLQDAFLENQTADNFVAVANPKINGTRALDVAARELAPQLDHFVAFSSIVARQGNFGQSNYGFANSAVERLCEQRRADGLPALAVQWGPIGDVGIILTTMHGDSGTPVDGTAQQRIASCLDTLGDLMKQPHAVTSSILVADKRRSQKKPAQDLVQVIANILGIKDPNKVSDNTSIAELGMDSLMGAEIRRTLEQGYDLLLGVQQIRELTFGKLQNISDAATA